VRPRHRREDIINMDLKEVAVKIWTGIGWLRMGYSGRAGQGRAGNFLTS
jgi:hypothetical protein